MDTKSEIMEPASLALKATNFYVIFVFIQAFLVFNGEYIWGIDYRMAVLYCTMPPTLMFAMLGLTELDTGKRLTWDDVNNSLIAKKDWLSKTLKEAGWSAEYFSVAVQITYFISAGGIAMLAFMILIMQGYITPQITPPSMMGALWITTIILVVPAEEMMFRGILPEYIRLTFGKSKYSEHLKYIIGAGAFGIFHFAAYGGSWPTMGFAIGMGIVLQFAKDYTGGLPSSMAIHLMWNAAVLGLLIPEFQENFIMLIQMFGA